MAITTRHLQAEEAGLKSKVAAWFARLFPQRNWDPFSGSVTLRFNPKTSSSKIRRLTDSLTDYSGVRITSTGGIAGKGSWVELLIQQPVPIYQLLHGMPEVKKVARKGRQIRIVFI
jgi:hypothetical protein